MTVLKPMLKLALFPLLLLLILAQWVGIFLTTFSTILTNLLAGLFFFVALATAGMLPGKVLCLKRRTDFLAGVTGVPLVHDISERSKLIVPFESIHAVVQSNQPGIVLPQHFHIGADLQIVTTKTAHILYDNDRDSVGFDFGNHLLKSGSVELRTRDTIIREVDAVGKTVLFGVVLQYSLLVGD